MITGKKSERKLTSKTDGLLKPQQAHSCRLCKKEMRRIWFNLLQSRYLARCYENA